MRVPIPAISLLVTALTLTVLAPTASAAPEAPECIVDGSIGVTCSAGPLDCTAFMNRWSYAHCSTGLPCTNTVGDVEHGRLTVGADACRAGFHLVG